ncbi:P-loop containing nucleoside triphosphate hydrolase [Pseudocohnilembus persalinus]|uniref:p-loop containing nucleoside triphosphate hydrolase n=1 Tax=Pseudocohnilembus persalinus TaxID=266149 RepID=A0A0V0QSB1_PSEPJ|nr:P-loop containing nucleoside triphosphate hydrolase [Pseudocohnilembus persalinus]|eukprot:KRX05047.1 P-loop containing nucleoside triphosphate hydrolase [Pseudocohnilembus persalinus]
MQESQYEEELEDYIPFYDIEALADFYNCPQDLKKLKEGGFATTKSLVMTTKKELMMIKGITEMKIKAMLDALKKFDAAQQGGGGSLAFQNGNQVMNVRKQVIKLDTGSRDLNELLGGGVESQSITEVYGEFRSGKTQLCHTLAVTSQIKKSEGGGQGKVLYVDTEGTFRPERIGPIAERYGLDPEEALGNILHAKAFSVEHMQDLLAQANKIIAEEGPFSLLIVDSIMALFRVDYSGRGELSERQQMLGKTMATLNKMADMFNLVVFITNQIMADPSGQSFGDNRRPIGGNVLAHASTTRVYFRKGAKEERFATLVDSPYCKEAMVKFKITDSGIASCDQ